MSVSTHTHTHTHNACGSQSALLRCFHSLSHLSAFVPVLLSLLTFVNKGLTSTAMSVQNRKRPCVFCISKLLDKIVQMPIQAFFDINGLMPKIQSAYRGFHSTETAVTKVGWLLQTVVRCRLFACSTSQQPLTLSTMTCCYSGLNVSLDCVASC